MLACERLSEPPGQPAFAAALYQLAELHRLRGEFEEAEAAYRKTAECGRSPYPGRALLRLAQGRRDDAAAAIGRLLRETRGRRARSKILGAAVEIRLACGDVTEARRAADELDALAQRVGTPFLRAIAAQAEGAILEVPYEAGRTQVLIAQACRALGDEDSAALDVSSRAAATAYAFEHRLTEPST